MTDAERKRLDEIARENRDAPMRHADQVFLIDLVRRDAARAGNTEQANAIYLRDCGTSHGAKGERDAAWIDGVREQASKDVASECLRIVHEVFAQHIASARAADVLHRGFVMAEACQSIVRRIGQSYGLNAGPTLTERVAAEVARRCVEIAEQVAMDPEAATSQAETIINAISELFGLSAGAQPDAEYTIQSRYSIPPTPAELDAAAGFPADLDNQISEANARAHEEADRERA